MSGDYQLEDTVYLPFTTRAFATGIPTALVSGEVQIYEDASITQITGAETLTVSLDSIAGFNMIQVDMTAANGFESGKSYTCILSAGTVDSVSVIGEVVAHFTIEMSAAALDLANGTDGLGAIKAETAAILDDTDLIDDGTSGLAKIATDVAAVLVDTADIQPNYATSAELAKVPKSDGTVSWNATALGAINAQCDTALTDYDAVVPADLPTNFGDLAITVTTGQVTVGTNNDKTGYTVSTVSDKTGYSLAADQSAVTIGTVTTNTDMRGTDSAALASVCTEARLAELDAANIPADVDAVLVDTGTTLDTKLNNLDLGIIYGTAQTGTLSTTVATTDLTGYVDDELIGRVIIFTGGTADGQASDITDYASASGTVTYTAITTAPANGDTFKIV